jgi:hypothetical protein
MYQESPFGGGGGLNRDRLLRLTTSPPSVSRLSRQFGIRDVSETCGPPLLVTGIALLYLIPTMVLQARHSNYCMKQRYSINGIVRMKLHGCHIGRLNNALDSFNRNVLKEKAKLATDVHLAPCQIRITVGTKRWKIRGRETLWGIYIPMLRYVTLFVRYSWDL